MPIVDFAHWRMYASGFGEIRNPGTRQIALSLDAGMTAWIEGTGPAPDVTLLVAALRCSGSTVPIAACRALRLVAASTPDPGGLVLFAFQQSTAPARCWMMRFLDSKAPESFRPLVELALQDRAASVRAWTCEGVDHGEYRDLIPQLRLMQSQDTSAEVRWAAERTAEMLGKGYWAKQIADGNWNIDVRESSGSSVGMCVDGSIVERIGLQKAAEWVRSGARADPTTL